MTSDDQALRSAISSFYTSPDAEPIWRKEEAMPYARLIHRRTEYGAGRQWTDTNEETCFSFILTEGGESLAFDISMVAPYFLLRLGPSFRKLIEGPRPARTL